MLSSFDQTLRSYRENALRGDVVAGMTTGVMLVPQAMAYAMLAGLPPAVGLYSAIVPLLAYAALGTSRTLAVGPVAIMSLLVGAGVGSLAEAGTPEYLMLATTLALMSGGLLMLMSALRAGFLVNFLSHPVISGFTFAAAIIIGLGQVKHLAGIDVPRSPEAWELIHGIAGEIGGYDLPTVIVGGVALALLIGLKKWNKLFPRALVVVALGIVAVKVSGDALGSVALVGDVPRGLPMPSWPGFASADLVALLPTAIIASLIGFTESISVAKALARRHGDEVLPNRELLALGAANLGAGLFGGYPVAGGFGRSAVNDQAGAKSRAAAVLTAAVVAGAVLFLTPLFQELPRAVLAAIIFQAVIGLIDLEEVKHLWHVRRDDLALLGVTFAATLVTGVEMGIGIGVVGSLLWFVIRTTQPHFAVLGQLPGTSTWRNVKHFPEAIVVPGVLAVRIDAQFYYGNVTFLKSTLRRLELAATEPVQAVVIDASSVNDVDSSADAALHELLADYQDRGILLYLATVKGPVREVMRRSGFREKLGEAYFAPDVQQAVDAIARERASAELSTIETQPQAEGVAS